MRSRHYNCDSSAQGKDNIVIRDQDLGTRVTGTKALPLAPSESSRSAVGRKISALWMILLGFASLPGVDKRWMRAGCAATCVHASLLGWGCRGWGGNTQGETSCMSIGPYKRNCPRSRFAGRKVARPLFLFLPFLPAFVGAK